MSGSERPAISSVRSRKVRATAMLLILLPSLVVFAGGCDSEESLQSFRDTALGGVSVGVQSIFTALIEGAFAAFATSVGGDSGDVTSIEVGDTGSDTSGTESTV